METKDEVRDANLAAGNERRLERHRIRRALKSGTMPLEQALDSPAAQGQRALELLGLAVVAETLRHGKAPCNAGKTALRIARQMELSHFATVDALSVHRRAELCYRVRRAYADAPTAVTSAPSSALS